MKPPANAFGRIAAFLASMNLTVVLLILSILLVFAATLDQVHLGVWGVQEKYFHSFFVLAKVPGAGVSVPIFPGGYLLGGVLLANLLAAHVARFRFSWGKSGIWMTHAGLILLIAGEGLSGAMQKDGQMVIDVGQTRRYTESTRETELAVIDATDPRFDDVVAIPSAWLEGRDPIRSPKLPFTIRPLAYAPNGTVRMRSQLADPPPAIATAGDGPSLVGLPAPVTTKPDEQNWPMGYVELSGPEGSIGIFLVSTMLTQPQTFAYGGRTWRLALRPARDALPFTITLKSFTHTVYEGTDIPNNFASTIRLRSDDGREDREVRISMNRPLRYAGRAFYQAGYENNDHTSILQVVRNPGWLVPYFACALIALGLLVQFGIHLAGYVAREARRAGASPSGTGGREAAP